VYKKYFKTTFGLVIFLILLIMIINIFVDIGNIYLRKIVTEPKVDEYIKTLLTSKNGLLREGWNERLIKTNLAKEAGHMECVILGSSHIMQISNIRNIGNIQKQCKSLLNLGVSGGSLEDIFVFSYFIFTNSKLPKKIFIDIDPWTLKFNMGSRYGAYSMEYMKMNKLLEIENNTKIISYQEEILKNLINWEYLFYNIKMLKDKKFKAFDYFNNKILIPTKPYIYSQGYEKSIILADGGHIYSSDYLTKQKMSNPNIPMGGGDYKISGDAYNTVAITNLKKLLNFYQKNNIEVNFILTPYHPNVFKNGKTKPVKHMQEVQRIIFDIVKQYDLKIYGSFFPEEINCKENEFLDFMHPTTECLNKIDFSH